MTCLLIRPLWRLEITNSFSWNDAPYQGRGINYGNNLLFGSPRQFIGTVDAQF
ncbi:hypothetical protein ABHV46_05410 [Asaia sp. BMEF1]|uniref:hypothetical protein n=1 Tax=Asaia sp. BMEF1 TaxID=3155932 RepID=UPI003F673C37